MVRWWRLTCMCIAALSGGHACPPLCSLLLHFTLFLRRHQRRASPDLKSIYDDSTKICSGVHLSCFRWAGLHVGCNPISGYSSFGPPCFWKGTQICFLSREMGVGGSYIAVLAVVMLTTTLHTSSASTSASHLPVAPVTNQKLQPTLGERRRCVLWLLPPLGSQNFRRCHNLRFPVVPVEPRLLLHLNRTVHVVSCWKRVTKAFSETRQLNLRSQSFVLQPSCSSFHNPLRLLSR